MGVLALAAIGLAILGLASTIRVGTSLASEQPNISRRNLLLYTFLLSVKPIQSEARERGDLAEPIVDYRASPIAGAGRIYFLSTNGLTTVVSASPEFRRVTENQLGDEKAIASPAISDGKIFIRGRKWLHCLQ